MENQQMLTKIALATALTIAAASTAMAANENDTTGGYRELGPGGVVTDGVNPVFHRSLRAHAGNSFGYAPGYPSKNTAK
jgi:hypothetical protein